MSVIRAKFDLAIIGGGIVGLATARQACLKHPKLKICVLEKEKELATHQSMRNSGVVHCGVYYKKRSLKSRYCVKGAQMVKEYCKTRNLPYNQCGKLIVATKKDELEILHKLFENATANSIEGLELFNPKQVEDVQPGCTKVLEAIWSPNTAIVDWRKVALSYASDFEQSGGTIITDATITGLKEGSRSVLLKDKTTDQLIEAKSVVNCSGLFSDFFIRLTGNKEHPKVVPFMGKYFELSDKFAKSIKTNIYPVPNPQLPFLGVHVTPRVDGSVLVGPTAMLVLGYEKYGDDSPPNFTQIYHILIRSGLRKMIRRKEYFKAGLLEIARHYSKERFTKEVNDFLPGLKNEDLIDTKFCGIRAQLVDKDGSLVDDFLFESGLKPEYHKVLHVRNAPSPAATSSLAIGERLVEILEERFI